MSDNILYKISYCIPSSLNDDEIKKQIYDTLDGVDKIYSYLIYAKYKNDALIGWLIEYNFSQKEEYNTLKTCDIVDEILCHIMDNKNTIKHVIAYKQPDIALMLDLYKPLMSRLALNQCNKWSELEYEDALSMCQLTMIKLYRKGYYVHKGLLKRSFENYILMELRHNKNKPEMVSLEQILHNTDNDEPLTLSDMLPDKRIELEQEDKENDELFECIFQEVKDIIIELTGERQFEQLLRDYGQKHTTAWSRKKMQQIKEKFNKLGITKKSFWRNL